MICAAWRSVVLYFKFGLLKNFALFVEEMLFGALILDYISIQMFPKQGE